jgi:type IV secretory pathway protease TraF
MEREGQHYARFGRVRALPGDVVAVIEGELTVNGEPLRPAIRADRAMGVVPNGSLLILPIHDQISNYPDSRTLGFIPRADVQARVLARMP